MGIKPQGNAGPPQQEKKLSTAKGSFLTNYFLIVLFLFGVVSLVINYRFTDVVADEVSTLEQHLEDSVQGNMSNRLRKSIRREKFISKIKGLRQQQIGIKQPDPNKLKIQLASAKAGAKAKAAAAAARSNTDDENPHDHRLSGLNCERYGGPSLEDAQEMVYWEDIPSDNLHVSPFKSTTQTQYMTFEPDKGGWNNIRMSMETVLGMAFAMGRTLVLPPDQAMYLLGKADKQQRNQFSFSHFFHMESISQEHVGFDIISMKEFLERVAMKGEMRNTISGEVTFPPYNRTDWDGQPKMVIHQLNKWLRESTSNTIWAPSVCMATFPKSADPADIEQLNQHYLDVKQNGGFPTYEKYIGKPFPVNATTKERMMENWAKREKLCIYDAEKQAAPVIHFPVIRDDNEDVASRLLVHFYAFMFFQDWREDLWMKRFIRDHVRYVDEIQCAAARVVTALRKRAKANPNNPSPDGEFDTFHVRRGDFQYKVTRFSADKILDVSKSKLQEGGVVYIATDERDKSFFQPLKDHYDVVFLDDFMDELGDINTNYYGMIDQLIASRGRTFFGCWFSTFTGYINRLIGYHVDDHQLPGYEQGIINAYYYALEDRYDHMKTFYPVKREFYAREFPTSWRLIDTGIGELTNVVQPEDAR